MNCQNCEHCGAETKTILNRYTPGLNDMHLEKLGFELKSIFWKAKAGWLPIFEMDCKHLHNCIQIIKDFVFTTDRSQCTQHQKNHMDMRWVLMKNMRTLFHERKVWTMLDNGALESTLHDPLPYIMQAWEVGLAPKPKKKKVRDDFTYTPVRV